MLKIAKNCTFLKCIAHLSMRTDSDFPFIYSLSLNFMQKNLMEKKFLDLQDFFIISDGHISNSATFAVFELRVTFFKI